MEPEGAGLDAPAPLGIAPDGGGKRVVFITEDDIRASAGEAKIEPKQDRKGREGLLVSVGQGTVVGWLLLKIRNLEEQNMSLQGQMFAAGMTIQGLRAALGKKAPGGLLVPQGASESGLVLPPGSEG